MDSIGKLIFCFHIAVYLMSLCFLQVREKVLNGK